MTSEEPVDTASARFTPQRIFMRGKAALFGNDVTLLDTISSHENNYNIIRVVLAASVIWFHASYIAGTNRPDWASRHLYPITDLGGLAVQCFFFLSGLFVAQSIHSDNNLPDFSIKRVMRIFPGLFACLVVTTLLVSLMTYGWRFWRALAIPETYGYILDNSVLNLKWSIPNLLAGNPSSTINGSIHTLNTEVKMYAMLGVFGLAGIAEKKRSIAIAAALILIAIAATGTPITSVVNAPRDTYAMITMFVAGVLAFAVADRVRVNIMQGLLLGLLFFLSPNTPPLHAIVFYSIAVWAMLLVGQWAPLRRRLKPRVDPSYGIYIYGWPCEQMVKALVPSATATAVTLLAIPLAGVFALFSWRYVEKPCMDMAKGITRTRTSLAGLTRVFYGSSPWRASLGTLLFTLAACVTMLWLSNRFNLLPVHPMASQIVAFGPHEASARDGFDLQPGGQSTLWVKVSGAPPADAVIIFDGRSLTTTVDAASMTLTATVPKSMIAGTGDKPIYLRTVTPEGIMQSRAVVLRLSK